MAMLEVVVTGGQSGADRAGWRAAKAAGIRCTGVMPHRFKAEDGFHPEFASLYGAVESDRDDYPSRTRANVAMSEAVLWFGNPHSPGGKLTMRLCREMTIPHCVVLNPAYVVDGAEGWTADEVAGWIEDELIGVPRRLMVAGNRESSSPGIGEATERFLAEVFRLLAVGGPVATRRGAQGELFGGNHA